jgi:AcrR family transcriptional regulator
MSESSMTLSNPSPNGDKHTERDQETQRHILKEAERLFVAKGFKGVSMKDIADEVQVTAAALYYHFPQGKQALFVSMLKQVMNDWSEETFRTIDQTEGLHAKLLTFAELLLSRRTSTFMSLMRDLDEFCRDKISKKDIAQIYHKDLQYIAAIFQQAIDRGEISADAEATTYSVMYQGMIMGIQFGQRFLAEELPPFNIHVAAQSIVDSLLNGIKKR